MSRENEGKNHTTPSRVLLSFSPTRLPSSSLSISFPPSLSLSISSLSCRKLQFRSSTSGSSLPDHHDMSDGDLLSVEPQELQFPFELKKQISSSLQLTNKTDSYVAFKVKTTNPRKYCVRPNTGVVLPHSTCDVTVTMQAQKETPPDLQCKDKFLLQSVVASPGATTNDITAEMFNKESGNNVEECKLKVAYVAPQRSPSPVMEGSEEGGSPRASVSDNGTINTSEYTGVSKAPSGRSFAEPEDNVSEVKNLLSELTKEKNSAIQLNNKLHQELETLRRKTSKNNGEFSFLHVILVGLVGLLIGYLLKQ